MTYIEGYTSKKAIRRMLNDYNFLDAKGTEWKEIRTSGLRNPDGIGGGRINKIMLDEIISTLPDEIRACVINRWIKDKPVRYSTTTIGITSTKYYTNCSKAVDIIYEKINGERAGVKNLLDAIIGK